MAFEMKPFNNSFFNMEPSDFFKDFGRRFFDDNFAQAAITTDIKELDDAYIVEAELPGMDKENIRVQFENNILTIAAQNTVENNNEDEEGRIIHKERSYRNVQRQFSFDHVDATQIKAAYQNGMLNVRLPKDMRNDQTDKNIPID
ncbi:Hsp20 family protein [Staphylococcus schleiferi subsp. coagulans]|uniref:Hsp20/alpha crystallin family protein n=1 Tax=Staphylococcus coagulans TaxID=74706 RepID=UPI0015FA8253|nr:Hsp20/alpha crystallin family protein [Staphylococcus coagulans]MBA8760528.1 Hsp20 family protein [Staphylococcus coagulans]MBA8769261.1 Hsp20 family protein [Staphylococcus coagulans]